MMNYKLWRISGVDDCGENELRECYKSLNSPGKRYLERPDAAQKGKQEIMVLTDETDSTETFEKTYRKIVDELPLKGCYYASMDVAEGDLNTMISEFLGINGFVSEQHKSGRNIKVQGSTLKEKLESYIHTKYGNNDWFSSTDLKKAFDADVQKIGLSTVSTYLARMSRDNILTRRGNHNLREYNISTDGRKTLKEKYGLQDDV